MTIEVAEKAGFCSGVSKAVNCLLQEAEISGAGSTYGPIVHNEEVVAYLQERSVSAVDDISRARGSFLAIRTHGITPEKLEQTKRLEGLKIIDLTCPRVKKVHEIAADSSEKGFTVIIFGNKSHPEVEGIIGWAGSRSVIVATTKELAQLRLKTPSVLIAQTTASPELYDDIKKQYRLLDPAGQIYDTLCPETGLRQKEVFDLAQRVEAFVVVGSATSANTKALFDSCRQLRPSCRVMNAEELDPAFVRQYSAIGLTAGASTPPWTIKEVVERMENEKMELQSEETEKEEVKEEELQPAEDEQVEAAQQEEAMDEQLDFAGDIKVAQVGEQVTGKVARVTDEEVYVDIGAKSEAILPVNEVHLEEEQTLADLFKPEDDLEVTVLDTDEQEDKVIVSHKRLARDKRLKELEGALENEAILEGKVKQVVSAGIVVDLGSGIEGFMPGSLVDIRFIPDFNEFKDQDICFKIQEYDREKNKLILNRRKVMEEESSKNKEATLQALEVGSNITGTVKRLTDFGAFVDVGGIDGLVHISELSWERVKHPKEVLQVGDEVEVKILEVIPEKERISLSIRKTQPDPWTSAIADLKSDQIVTGKVTRVVNFGAFIEIKPGVEGLAHISQMADYHVKHPSEVLNEGDEVEVKIIELKPKAKRISLSLKEASGAVVDIKNYEGDDAENGNVTLGDVFGDLFDREDFNAGEAAAVEGEEDTEPEGGQG